MPAPEFLQNGVFGVQVCVFLVVVGDFYKSARFHGGIFSAHDLLDERGFSRAVVPDDRAFFAAAQGEGHIFQEGLVPGVQVQPGYFQDLLVRLFRIGEGKTGRGGRQFGLFDKLHFFQLFHAAQSRFRRRRAHEVSVHVVL